jgi:hypothetical protein
MLQFSKLCNLYGVILEYSMTILFYKLSNYSDFLLLHRSPTFHNFVKVALTKNPKKRPTAEKLLQVSGIRCMNSKLS